MPNVIYSSQISIQGPKNQDVVLYPKNGYYISNDGTNEFWGNTKTLSSSNEVLYIQHQKTFIPNTSLIEDGKLKIYVADIYGTSDNITLNVYATIGNIDADTAWKQVSSSGSLRGELVGSLVLEHSDKNNYMLIDIENYLSDYIYGSMTSYGLIIEASSITGTGYVDIVGLYCWNEEGGEKQNPVIEITYNYTPSAYKNTVKTSGAITEDAYISQEEFASNFNNNILLCEQEETGGDNKKTLVKFDLSEIPNGSDILKALIYIPRNTDDFQREHKEIMRRIYQDWDEVYATWRMADSQSAWENPGSYHDVNNTYDSYNFIVNPDLYTYDVTKLLQVVFESFSLTNTYDFYGFVIKDQDLIFNSKEFDNSAVIRVEYLASAMNQPPEAPTLDSPTSGSYIDSKPTFIATINDDNAYGSIEGDDLHVRLEIDDDDEFTNSTSYSTSDSTTGWHWSALGDFSDDSTTFPISAGSYTPGTSKIKFVMSETGDTLSENKWYWRMIIIDVV